MKSSQAVWDQESSVDFSKMLIHTWRRRLLDGNRVTTIARDDLYLQYFNQTFNYFVSTGNSCLDRV